VRGAVAFFGPKNYALLDGADQVAGFPTGFRDTVDFGHLPGIGLSLALIGKPLLWLLQQFQNVVGNWGIAIILLTVCVKLVTLFWTTRSMRSMKAMAALSPQIKELQDKYGTDKTRVQQETMALYKTHGVSPLAGCAPMFLQIPIWSALYLMLSATGELYQQAFVPGWINDLTNSDPTHVLPVLLVATMFLQARLTPQAANQPGAKMMQYGMPLMFGVMSFYFPAGLSLYIFTNTVLSSLHSIYMNKFDKKSLAIAEQLARNKAAVAARAAAAKEAEELAKQKGTAVGGGNNKKNGKSRATNGGSNGGSIKALKTTAEDAVELAAGTGTDGEALAGTPDEQDDAADVALGASATTGTGQARPRRKKRRR
jgi:YidC/Oxa1 family membrane protein insertase